MLEESGFLRFECQKCGRCCSSEIIVSYPDIHRLIQNEEYFLKVKSNLQHRVIKGKVVYTTNSIIGVKKRFPCAFLIRNLCSIYPSRPKICRTYPFSIIRDGEETQIEIKEVYRAKAPDGYFYRLVLLDKDCPGLNKGPILDVKKVFFECFDEYVEHKESYY